MDDRLGELIGVASLDMVEHNDRRTYLVRLEFVSEENALECLRLLQDVAADHQ
jgi:hypothetical protein